MMKDLYELSAELNGVSMIVSGLSNQLDDRESDILTPQSMKDALFGVSNYLDRIAEDLIELESSESKREEVAS